MIPRLAVRFVPVAVAVALAAGCSSAVDGIGEPAPSPTTQTESSPPAASPSVSSSPELPTATMNQPFRHGAFEITVTKIEMGVKTLPQDQYSRDYKLKPETPKNGQFVLVWITAKNVSSAPAAISESSSELVDDQGKTYDSDLLTGYNGVQGDEIGDEQQPDTTRSGPLIFDVPTSLTKVAKVVVQSELAFDAATTNPPTVVNAS